MRSIVLLLLMYLLTACVPAPYGPYYRPSYPDNSAALIKEFCGGEAGPPSVLTFNVADGVTFTVATAKSYSERSRKDVPLTITLNVPSNTTAQFLSDDLSISGSPNGEDKIAVPLQVAALVPMGKKDVVDIDRIGPVTSLAVQKFIQAHPDHAVSEVHIDFNLGNEKFHPEVISLHLPAFSTSGASITIPPLKLVANTQDKGWWKYETREHKQAREERYVRCLKETPHLHCKNILQVIDEGFRLDMAGIEITGRLAKADFTQKPKITGRLNFASRSVEPWQFSTNHIRAEDIKTGETHHYYFNQFAVFFGWYDVPLSTAIKGGHSELGGNKTLRIATSLGEKYLSKYYIKLPPILINGHKYVLKPIELELKLFDGGIEPFNC